MRKAEEGRMQNDLSVAVIGGGYWGKNLIRNFEALGTLKAVCDSNVALHDQYREQYPNASVCSNLKEVLGRSDIDCVAVVTPAETHFDVVRESLLSGKHVFVEKPLALTLEDGRKLVDLARQKSLTLMVGHLLRYHPAFIRLSEMVTEGELGRVNYIYSNRLNLGKIRREENILWSFAPHDVSMILALAGERPQGVVGSGGAYLHQRLADVTVTNIDFPSGLKAHIFVSWLHPFKEQKLVVVGERKMAVFDDTRPWPEKLLLYPHQIDWRDSQPVPIKGDPEPVVLIEAEPLRAECVHFLECASQGRTPWTDGEEGLAVLEVLRASQKSLDNCGKRVEMTQERTDSAEDVFVHPTAEVAPGARLGRRVRVWRFSHVMAGAEVGDDCSLGQSVNVMDGAVVGKGCKVQDNVSIYKGVTLEDDVFVGPSAVFTNVHNPRSFIPRMDQLRETLVRQGASLGANCTIVCGNVVGRYAFVAAGSVVTQRVADHALVVGVPARRVGWVCECGVRLLEDLTCPECGERYAMGEQGLVKEIAS